MGYPIGTIIKYGERIGIVTNEKNEMGTPEVLVENGEHDFLIPETKVEEINSSVYFFERLIQLEKENERLRQALNLVEKETREEFHDMKFGELRK